MNYDYILMIGLGLMAWGILTPLFMLFKLRKTRQETMYLKTELKSILRTLKEAESYKRKKDDDASSKTRQPLFASPKYTHHA